MSGLNGSSNGTPNGKHPGGRPSKYRPEFAEQARKLCLIGATDVQIADFFGVIVQTLFNWRAEHPEFLEATKSGKSKHDQEVEDSLLHRAKGYSHAAVKIVADAKTGAQVSVPYTEYYPPDTTACIFWLKNRQPERWRDRHEHQHSGGIDIRRHATRRAMTDPATLDAARTLAERMELMMEGEQDE